MERLHDEWMVLNKQDEKTLAVWWCKLNKWEWVKELGQPEDSKSYELGKRTALLGMMELLVSEKLLSRTWNKKMGDAEFEDWWINNKSPDKDIREAWMNKRMGTYT